MSTEDDTVPAAVVELTATNGAEEKFSEVEAPAQASTTEAAPSADVEPSSEPETKATAAPSRRSTRISNKPTAKEESVAVSRPRRSSTKKRGVEESEVGVEGGGGVEDGGKVIKKTKQDTTEGSLSIGDVLPSLTLKNEKDEQVDVGKIAEEKGVVLFLVPKADTPGCTTQACGYRDIYPDFTSLGYEIYCVSADSSTAQKKWQDKKSLPYPLLSDPTRTLITTLGAADKGKTKRSHFVFEKGGRLLERVVGVKPGESPKLALEFIKSIDERKENGKAEGEGESEEGKEDMEVDT